MRLTKRNNWVRICTLMSSSSAKTRVAILVLLVSLISLFLATKNVSAQANLVAEINQFRASRGLPPVQTDPQSCSFANLRASEISTDFSHNGFYNRANNRTLPYSRYRLVTENLAWAPGGLNPVQMWINSPSHAGNMLKNTPFVCVSQHGDHYAYEGRAI